MYIVIASFLLNTLELHFLNRDNCSLRLSIKCIIFSRYVTVEVWGGGSQNTLFTGRVWWGVQNDEKFRYVINVWPRIYNCVYIYLD